jgi:folate-binding protein YgfZ
MNFKSKQEFHPWQPAAWLRVSGSDALNFLQGQFTNDLRKPMAGGAIYGLWLNQKGRVVADSFVLAETGGSEFWLGSYFSPALVIRERLESCIIADDVMVEDCTAAWRAATLFGSVNRDALLAAVPGSRIFAGRRDHREHHEWVFPAAAQTAVVGVLHDGKELTDTQAALRRVLAGIPAVPADIGPGDLPNEGNLEAVAISYTKGCYLGQEVMARLKTMGQVRRRLVRVTGTGLVPPLPGNLYQGARKAGELRSAVATGEGYAGLALLTLLNLVPAAGLGLTPESAATVHLTDPI